MTTHKKKCACGHLLDVEDVYQKGREDAINDFADVLMKRFCNCSDILEIVERMKEASE